ncbi:hypothetical protein D3C85_1275820 [compost metagenome]
MVPIALSITASAFCALVMSVTSVSEMVFLVDEIVAAPNTSDTPVPVSLRE